MANPARDDPAGPTGRRVLDALEEFGPATVEAGLARAYLESIGAADTSNAFLRERVDAVSAAEARAISRAALGRESPELIDILRAFELAVDEDDRRVNGVYYTPEPVVEYIVAEAVSGDALVCDPASGGGAFLLEATDRIHRTTGKPVVDVLEENVYGADLIGDNVRRSKLLLLLYAASRGEEPREVAFNLVRADSLRLEWERAFPVLESRGFDAVVGNPPYVRIQHQSPETRAHLLESYETVREGNFNTYIPFVELAIRLLDEDGTAGLLTPLNYFTTLTGRHLRAFLQEGGYVRRIVDFGELVLFEDAATYTAITFLDRTRKSRLEYVRVRDEAAIEALDRQGSIAIPYSSLDPEKWRLLAEEEYEAVEAIESYRRLDRIASIHAGIATLKDDAYTVMADERRDGRYVAEHDGEEYLVEPAVCKELVKISAIDGAADLRENRRRIIFPYREVATQASLEMDDYRVEHEVIPPDDLAEAYPGAYEYLTAVRDRLATRENGAGASYEPWYRYGRSQGIEFVGERLYTPTYSDGPRFVRHEDETALFCNGYAVFPEREEPAVLEAVCNSRVMDYYVRKTSKEIRGDYQCYQKNFIETFSVPPFDPDEREFLRTEDDGDAIDAFLIEKYGVEIPH